MTKKDYELFASFLNNRNARGEEIRPMVDFCKNVFWTDNKAFKPEMFERACYEGMGRK